VAGALLVALAVNVAWVTLGPDDGGDRKKIEAEVRRAWTAKGAAPREVTCTRSGGRWTCEIESSRGDRVDCPIGDASAFYRNPDGLLQATCRAG
jgi:hypothetical protein